MATLRQPARGRALTATLAGAVGTGLALAGLALSACDTAVTPTMSVSAEPAHNRHDVAFAAEMVPHHEQGLHLVALAADRHVTGGRGAGSPLTRLPGDPGPLRYLRYAVGFRLPEENHGWVRHDLTDAGWRGRMMARHLLLMLPVCVVFALLPAQWSLRVAVVLLIVLSSTFVVAINMTEIRRARLRQHGFPTDDESSR